MLCLSAAGPLDVDTLEFPNTFVHPLLLGV